MNLHALPWLKFAHDSYIFGFRLTASPLVKAAFLDLLCLAMKQTPALSIPNDDNALCTWLGLSIKRWQKIKDAVLSQFSLNPNDNRYYSPMLVELYSDSERPQQSKPSQPPKRAKTNAERQADYRARKDAEKEALRNAQNNEIVTPQTVTCNADVTASNVTCNEKSLHLGGKGGDLELRLDNLDKNIVVTDIVTNQSVTPCNAVTPQQTTRFKMPFDFNVSIEELQPFMAKLEVPLTKHNSHHLNHFVAHYLATDFKNTREQWIFQYAKWLERQREEVVEQPTTTSKPVAEFIQPVKPLWESLAEQKQQQQANAKTAEQLAKGDDALAKIRKQLGLKAA